MASITITDDQFARLEALAQLYHRTPQELLAEWIDALPAPIPARGESRLTSRAAQEYTRKWEAFMQLVGSIQHGEPLSNEEIDELIGEEAAQPHDPGTADAGNRAAGEQHG